MKIVFVGIVFLTSTASFALPNPAAVLCEDDFKGNYSTPSGNCEIAGTNLVDVINKKLSEGYEDPQLLCESELSGFYDQTKNECTINSWDLYLKLDEMSSIVVSNVVSKNYCDSEGISCIYSIDGEYYEPTSQSKLPSATEKLSEGGCANEGVICMYTSGEYHALDNQSIVLKMVN